MSSILTNMAAMTAVANLTATQKSLAQVQNQISSGLAVSSAQDNAAYYSIATNMRTNIGDLSAVSNSLNLGTSVVATATSATTNLTTVLQSISKQLVTASQPGTDLNSIQTNIAALRTQLQNTVAVASFNGVNLVDGSTSANPQVQFVAGVTGSGADTTVNTLTVDTTNTNFSGAAYVVGGAGSNALVDAAAKADNALNTAQTSYTTALNALSSAITAGGAAATDGTSATFKQIFGSTATQNAATGAITGIVAGTLAAALVGTTGTYTQVGTGTTPAAATSFSTGATGTTSALGGALGVLYGASASNSSTTGTATSAAGAAATADAAAKGDATANKIYGGALFSISQISLTSASADGTTPATSAAQIAAYIKQVGAALTAVNNASETFGAASSNISLQSTYTSALSDSITTGVGSLVDADMNAASTRLSALQTQQQLGVQALSVANQNSQLILKLFGG